MPYADVNGQRIYYQDSGGHGPPVVFSHGYLMDHEMWGPQVEVLESDFRCVRYDERCWGQTEPTDDPFDYWSLADDCLGLLDALEITDAVLVGMSQGGFLTMRAALRAPERVRAVVLVDTDPFAFDDGTIALYRDIQSTGVAGGVTDELAATLASFLFAPDFDWSTWRAKWRARPIRSTQSALECLVGRDDISGRLGEIRCPALVIHGEVDVPFPIDQVGAWAETLGDLRGLVRVAGSGHTSNLEHPEVVTPAVQEFLGALP